MNPLAAFGRDRTHWLVSVAVLDAVNARAPEMSDHGSYFTATAISHNFGSPVLWLAMIAAAVIAFAQGREPEPLRRGDGAIVLAGLVAALLPMPRAGALMVAAIGACLVLTALAGSRAWRAGVVLSALAGTLVWGHFVLALVGRFVLPIDGALAGLFGQVVQTGNVLRFPDSNETMVIADGCSSLHNVTVALLLWATLTQLLEIRLSRASLGVCLAAILANVAVNVVRLVTLVHHRAAFDYWHSGGGGALFAWAGLTASAVIVYGGCFALAPRRV